MKCYQCLRSGTTQEAAGLCHHCSAALCPEHICEVQDSATVMHILAPSMELPIRARILLCSVCKAALDQPSGEQSLFENTKR